MQLADNLEAKQKMEKMEWKYWKEVEKRYEQFVPLPLLLSDSDDDGQNEAHQYAWLSVKKRLNADPLQIAKEMVMLSPFPSLSPQQLVSPTKDSNQRKRMRHRKTMAILATKTVANGGIHSGASSASHYVPLTDGLTAKEAQTVQIARLDDDAFIGKNPMANLARWWMGSVNVEGNFNPVRAILLSMMHSLFGSFGNDNVDADEEDALNNYDEILIEEETEDACVGSPRENKHNIIGNNKDNNKATTRYV
jgi:hypothetical protein